MMYYRKIGKGKTIVLIHGFANSGRSLIDTKKYLKGYQIIAIDLPGHGKSQDFHSVSWSSISSNITKILKKEGIKEYVLGGHSLGGMAALQHYVRRKKGIKALVILNSTSFYKPNIKKSEYIQHFVGMSKDPNKNWEVHLRRIARLYRFFKNTDPNILNSYVRMIFSHDLREKLIDSEIPSMVLQAENDFLIPKTNTESTARLLGAKLYKIKGGHHTTMDNLEGVCSILRRFLKWIKY